MKSLMETIMDIIREAEEPKTINRQFLKDFNFNTNKGDIKKLKTDPNKNFEDQLRELAMMFISQAIESVNLDVPQIRTVTVPNDNIVKIKGDGLEATVTIESFKIKDFTLKLHGKNIPLGDNYDKVNPTKRWVKGQNSDNPEDKVDVKKLEPFQNNPGFWKVKTREFNRQNKTKPTELPDMKILQTLAKKFINYVEEMLELHPSDAEVIVEKDSKGKLKFNMKKGPLNVFTHIDTKTYEVDPNDTSISYGKTQIKK